MEKYLSYFGSKDPDLRNSAIVALGESKGERAVEPFGKMISSTDYSSQVLIVQALKEIITKESSELLTRISKSHPNLVSNDTDEGHCE